MPRAAVLLAPGFEEGEALTIADILRRGGVEADLLGTTPGVVVGGHGITVEPDATMPSQLTAYDMVVLPGGQPGATNLHDDPAVLAAVRGMADAGRWVAAICAAPMVLGAAGLLDGHRWTAYPGYEHRIDTTGTYVEQLVVQDGRLITSRGPASAYAFGYALLDALGADSEAVKQRMVYRHAFDEREVM